MKIFFDFEFIEDGSRGILAPISLGMIREDGATYYAIYKPIPWTYANDWVRENITPVIEEDIKDNPDFVKNKYQIRNELIHFCGEKPEFWGYFCSYDWVLLAQTMGRMVDLPNTWPMHPMDLKQWMKHLGVERKELDHIPNEKEHHALSDAVWNRTVHKFLAKRDYDLDRYSYAIPEKDRPTYP